MRRTYLIVLVLLLLISPILASSDDDDDDDDEIISREFSLRIGDGIKIGDYRVELVDIVSVKDGLVEIKAWKRLSDFEEWRVLEEHRDSNIGDGSGHGGLTLTVVEIFDEDSLRMRAEYREEYGYPRKYITEKALAPKSLPKLTVEKRFDKTDISAGDEVTATISIKNIGNDTADDVSIIEAPPLSQFRYLAGYPPKVKSKLSPGESDFAVYSMVAVTEGEVKVPSVVINYADAKDNIYSASSSSVDIIINPKRKPNLELSVETISPIEFGLTKQVNVTILNSGKASAYRVEVKDEVRPANGGLEIVEGSLENTFFEIAPGVAENYSVKIKGSRSGDYAVTLKASYQSDGEMMQKETAFQAIVLEREYKYLYYVPIVPLLIIVIWVFRRYREYKY